MRVPAIIVGTTDSPHLAYHKGDKLNSGHGLINCNALRIYDNGYFESYHNHSTPARIWEFSKKHLIKFLKNFLDCKEFGRELPNYLYNEEFSPEAISGSNVNANILLFKQVETDGKITLESYPTTIHVEAIDLDWLYTDDLDEREIGCYDDEGILCVALEIDIKDGSCRSMELLNDSIEIVLLQLINLKIDEEDIFEEEERKRKFARLQQISERYEEELKKS